MQPIHEKKYIDNDIENGLVIDWNEVDRLYKSLHCPKHVYPVDVPWTKANYFILFSIRDTGKTTNALLKGLCAYILYGVKIEWIRQKKDMIKEKDVSKLFDTIIACKYILQLTDGKYSSVYYDRNEHGFFLCNYSNNETGRPSDIDTECFIHFLSIDNMYNIKSNYTSPFGDYIVLDEFQNATILEEEFQNLFHIISTIRRHRRSSKILIMGNTISPYNYYFKEFDITKIVLKMHPNERLIHTTPRGTNMFIEYIDKITDNKEYSESRAILNNEYYGFANLNSIVGGGWDIPNYPHITHELDREKEVLQKFYLKYQYFYCELNYCYHPSIGSFVFVRPILEKHMKKDIYLFTDTEPKTPFEIYGVGKEVRTFTRLWALFGMKRFLFTTNDLGSMVESFYNLYR